MRKYLSALIIICVIALCFLPASCNKDEDSEKQNKESLIKLFNSDISADSIEAYVSWMENMGTRFTLADNRRSVAVNIKNKFASFGISNSRLDSFLITKTYRNVTYQQYQYNVLATIFGSEHPDSVSIMGAHYDNILKEGDPFAIVYGANDNASGTAAALELARVMMKNNYAPSNTIEFVAFGAEEIGLYGSIYYAGQAKLMGKKIKMMLNNDMIAYQSGVDPSGWIVNIIDYENSYDLRIKAEAMCSKYTQMSFINDNTYNKQSDSYPFFKNAYKAIFFFAPTPDPNYHTLEDKAINCNFDYCREVTKISCALLVDNN
jgi:Zn-dependent M28 family amino/carboxypeptidase